MSRSAVDRRPLWAEKLVQCGIVLVRHAACWSMVACFYVKPLPTVDVNDPPQILTPQDNPQLQVVRGSTVTLAIRASDPEGDPLFCEWPDLDNVPHEPDPILTIGEVSVCRVTILDLDALDDDFVEALVLDGDPDNVVSVVWQLVFP